MPNTGPFAELVALTSEHSDLVSRIAAPLWARVGRPIDRTDLAWARALLGENGSQNLLFALREFGAIEPGSGVLSALGLSRMISTLLDVALTNGTSVQSPELVWTLPHSHTAHTVRGQTYSACCLRLIREASESLTLVSPFVDAAGIGIISGPLLAALAKGVAVRLFVHDALNVGTPTSRVLEELRREAERIQGDLSVFSADVGTGRDRLRNPMFHAKLVIRDAQALLLGSANLTSHALVSNFEAGVLLGNSSAEEALFILDGVLKSKMVYLVFSTKKEVNQATHQGAQDVQRILSACERA
jgi:phosphatidylserine/phosphatidylglycerophosphate/cardiolipin synthase-like enzyme